MEIRTYAPAGAVSTQALFARVYAWMMAGLVLTAAVAFVTVRSEALLNLVLGNRAVFFGLILAELGLVVLLSARIHRMEVSTAAGAFLLYAALNGLTLSVILLAYTAASAASVFAITALTFGAMSLYGFTTKRDLSSVGSLLFMALIGLIIASVVNLFLRSETMYWVISMAGVLIFVGLTAWDTQKIKRMGEEVEGETNVGRLAILGALTLYLDFINLFLFLLRILGRRR